MMDAPKIRILIADDHPIMRSGLAVLLKYEPDMEVVAEARNGVEAIDLFRQHQPDVTLMDMRMPDLNGVDAIVAIRQDAPDARILIVSTYSGDESIYRGLQAGAKGYLLKDAPLDDVIAAIRTIHAGENYLPAEIGAKLAERFNQPQLSDRESEVLQLMSQGKSNQEIAADLFVSEGTVKFHINNIYNKLKVKDRAQAVLTAIKRGIVLP
ncbi:MAG: response regulator transcription factor [Synechococcales bacterium]|nr:response regulator transcription factor [Synechococcales bacterium]